MVVVTPYNELSGQPHITSAVDRYLRAFADRGTMLLTLLLMLLLTTRMAIMTSQSQLQYKLCEDVMRCFQGMDSVA